MKTLDKCEGGWGEEREGKEDRGGGEEGEGGGGGGVEGGIAKGEGRRKEKWG